MLVSGIDCKNPLVGVRWGISLALSINGPRKQSSHLVEPPVSTFQGRYFG